MASDDEVAEAVGEVPTQEPITVRLNRATPSLSASIDVLFSTALVLFGLYWYVTASSTWGAYLALAFAAVFALQGVLRLVRFAVKRGTSQVAKIEGEVAVEQHPDGCMCPFCVSHRASEGQEVNPYE